MDRKLAEEVRIRMNSDFACRDLVVGHNMKEGRGCEELSAVAHMDGVHYENSRIEVDAFHSFGKVDLVAGRRITGHIRNDPRSLQVLEAVIQLTVVEAPLCIEMSWVRVDDYDKYILKVGILPPD